jgi:two-component system, NarL family, sensor histidine kinase UhpB
VNRLREHWRAALTLAIVLSVGVLCLINGARRVGRSFPGFLIAENRIVLSIGRPGWSVEKAERVQFAKVIAVDGQPISDAVAIERRVSGLPPGTPVTYRFRKQADVFTATVDVQRFELSDFLTLYGVCFGAGLCFALTGLWSAVRYPRTLPATSSFFVLCETAAIALLTGGDVSGPYWFTRLYFAAQCIVPAAILHFASSYPEPIGAASRWRPVALNLLYVSALGLAVYLNWVADDPSLFLPLIYTLYLLLANALLLYLGHLIIVWWSTVDRDVQRSIRYALAALLASATAPGIIFVIYPALKQPISPNILVGPLATFAPLTALALRHAPAAGPVAIGTSVRARLSLLFLGALETVFLAGLAIFWFGNSWNQLVSDFALNFQQRSRVETLLQEWPAALSDRLRAIDALVQTLPEETLVACALDAAATDERANARHAVEDLADLYATNAAALEARRRRLNDLGAVLVVALVITGVVQAVVFMMAVRRWLIRPVEQLTDATRIIATGNLGHRIALDGAREFSALGESVNAMAASLAQIQRRIDAAQEARTQAAGAARDAERQRLARELHDGTLQDLSAVKLLLEGAAKTSPSPLSAPIDGIIQIIVRLRRIVDDLGAPHLDRVAIDEAVAAYAHLVARGHGIDVRTDLAPDALVADWTSRDVYRIAQEAITNAVRHGAPDHVSIRLQLENSRTVLEIEDDGTGFDLDKAALGTGIRGMRERADAIGAALEITTAPGKGTKIRLVLPPKSPL